MRRLEGERFNVITLKWWGRPRDVPTFEERHGLRGTFIASSAFLRGLERPLGSTHVKSPRRTTPLPICAAGSSSPTSASTPATRSCSVT